MTPFFQRPGVGGLLRGLCPDGGPGSGLDPIVVIIIIIINVNMHIYIYIYMNTYMISIILVINTKNSG